MNEAGTMEHAAHTYGVYSHTKEAVWVGEYLYIGGTYPDKKLCHGFQNDTQGIAASGTGDIGFTLTPNPTQGRCLLEMAEGATPRDNCWATMTDAQGREVMRKQVVSQKTVIATDNLASGMYLVTLSTPKGSVSQRLLVK